MNKILIISYLTLLCFYTGFSQNPLEEVKKDLEKFSQSKVYKSLPEALQNPEKVLVLDLGNQNLQELPSTITKLINLQKLSLYGNQLKKLPEEITLLKSLKYLDLYYNHLSELPANFADLQTLEYLDLGWNQFKAIPSSVLALKNLKNLHLYGNRLSEIPTEITKLENLENLRLGKGFKFFFGGNRLKRLPDNFGDLKKLQELYLPDNSLRQLPSSFQNLKRLKWLDLRHNRFQKIPTQIQNLDSLKYLSIWDRGFPKKNKDSLQNKLPQTNFDFVDDYEGNFWAMSAGFQQGKYSFVELGIARAFRKDILTVAFGASLEKNLNAPVTGAKLSFWANGLTIFSAGLHTIYYFGDSKNTFALRPEIGLGWSIFNISYGYNILFSKNIEQVNTHLISAKLLIPFSPAFSIFK